ncbi:glycosyl hydrolase [Pedobacter frigiditerrae]|uniref:Glycosyl hydrolase n=1 Tax=Pedobacter frigiditerrae TaxID=2530452 RepID=A0A4R0MQ02_9SPHI|nr:glycoside hydrolase family 3 C-terminal domain-containing protein [Pedobacter frigiditerrae]TCC88627.1 glycosyl hydrolase [Pedobacter frigiditerrae]
MKTRLFIAFIFCATTLSAQAQNIAPKPFNPFVPYEEAEKRANQLIRQMTVDEKINMVRGQGFHIAENKRLGIPPVNFTDASQGVRLHAPSDTVKVDNVKKTVAYPPTIQLAATWNRELAYRYAYAIGEEAKSRAINVLLGPGVNIYRLSQNGRNFEYMGEDPYLVSRMTENYVTGMQNTGTMAVVKHFVANNTDLDRRKSNSNLDERTLHEIYMPAFKAAIDAGVLGVMTSYNLVHGEWAGQSAYVIKQLLRKELGYRGLVMSDWTSVWDAEKIIKSGQNLEMPKGESLANTKALLDAGKVDISEIDEMVKYLMISSIMMGYYDRKPLVKEQYHSFPEHEKIALQTAREGIVLLENRNNILPLKADGRILVTGKYVLKNAAGGGSGRVLGYDVINMKTAIANEFKAAYFIDKPTDQELKSAPCIIYSVGTNDTEAVDRPFNLNKADEAEIQRISSLNPRTIVVVNSGSGIKMTNWNKNVAAIIYAFYPGQVGQLALAEILSGKVNPSGKLPFTIERDFKDSPAFGYEPGDRPMNKNAPKDGDRSKIYDVNYKEGIFVGYRWYEHQKIAPLYPFGYGLSFTSFLYTNLNVDAKSFAKEGIVKVSFELKNTGKREGAEITQVYIADRQSSIERPVKELKGFQKIHLKPGEIKKVEMLLHKKDFQFWSPTQKDWVFEPGDFGIMVGASSSGINLTKDLRL